MLCYLIDIDWDKLTVFLCELSPKPQRREI